MEAATVREIAQTSRTEAATKKYAATVERIRTLEQQINASFDSLLADTDTLREVGIRAELDLEPPLTAALSVWKNERSEERVRTRIEQIGDHH